jgi:hypothetical protein
VARSLLFTGAGEGGGYLNMLAIDIEISWSC